MVKFERTYEDERVIDRLHTVLQELGATTKIEGKMEFGVQNSLFIILVVNLKIIYEDYHQSLTSGVNFFYNKKKNKTVRRICSVLNKNNSVLKRGL